MSYDAKQFIEESRTYGFTNAGELRVSQLEFRPEVHDMCKTCDAYGTNWKCPPGCESIDVLSKQLQNYSFGIVLQTTGQLEDELDFEVMGETYSAHKDSFSAYIKELRSKYPDILPLSSDTCTLCEKCTYPDAPCRFPSLAVAPIESYGLVVSQLCQAADIPYYYGKLTITYTSCFLLN